MTDTMAEVDRKLAARKVELWNEYKWQRVSEKLPRDGAIVLVAIRVVPEQAPWWTYFVSAYVDDEFRDMDKVGDDSILNPYYWKPIYTPVEAFG